MLAKYQGVFRSRWKALWWGLGVCTTAYCTVPSQDGKSDPATQAVLAAVAPALPDSATRELTPQEEAAMQAVAGDSGGLASVAGAVPGTGPGAAPSPAPTHVNPWALPGKG